MEHVLTVKISYELRESLEELARLKGVSKGALVREALGALLASVPSDLERVAHLTEALYRQKRPRVSVSKPLDWNELYRAAGEAPVDMSPEEEVARGRRRDL